MSGPASGFRTSLQTPTPEAGFELAIQPCRRRERPQPNADVLKKLRPGYTGQACAPIVISQVVALHFQSVAAADDYRRS